MASPVVGESKACTGASLLHVRCMPVCGRGSADQLGLRGARPEVLAKHETSLLSVHVLTGRINA